MTVQEKNMIEGEMRGVSIPDLKIACDLFLALVLKTAQGCFPPPPGDCDVIKEGLMTS